MTEKGVKVGEGRTAEIFAWGEGQVVKLFRPQESKSSVEYEAQIAVAVQASGIPCPAVGAMVELEGRFGLIYERVQGISLLQAISKKPWTIVKVARQFAELHAAINTAEAPQLPTLQEYWLRAIRAAPDLSPDHKAKFLKIVEGLPEESRVCHGDFHPDNVLISERGLLAIDWTNAVRGNPLADVARTSLLLQIGTIPSSINPLSALLLRLARRFFLYLYLKNYFRLRPGSREQLEFWRPLVAAARLVENITEEKSKLLKIAQQGV